MSNPATSGTPGREAAVLAVLVALGGFLGAVARFGAMEFVSAADLPFWWATFSVNVIGCALMGVLLARVSVVRRPRWRAFLGFGVLGAFTTFSTFGADIVELSRSSVVAAGAYLLGSVATCLAGVLIGEWVARRRLT